MGQASSRDRLSSRGRLCSRLRKYLCCTAQSPTSSHHSLIQADTNEGEDGTIMQDEVAEEITPAVTENHDSETHTTPPLNRQSGDEDVSQESNTEERELEDKITSFQQSYMKNGIRGFGAQHSHLIELAEVYERRFTESNDWRDALKAFSLYNSAAAEAPNDDWKTQAWNLVSNFLSTRNKSTEEKFYQDVDELRDKLSSMRDKVKELTYRSKQQKTKSDCYQSIKEAALESNDLMVDFARSVIQKAIGTMVDGPPCGLAVVGIGSLGRGEATPYSDVEYMFLIENSTHEQYFESLAVMTYFFFGSLQETKLSSLDIDELKGWFVDGRMRGCQIDGITETSGNVPTGNKTRPNVFLSTTSKLLKVYKEILHQPSEDASRGDLTAMLSFVKLIFSDRNGEILLQEFVAGKRKEDGHMPQIRMDANIKMLASDLAKYEFSPDFDEYITGFSMNIKTHIYRFPSLLVTDLSIILNNSANDSWETIERWSGDSFKKYLKFLLANACLYRLLCYMHTDSCKGDFDVIRNKKIQADITHCNSIPRLVFSPAEIWRMTTEEFYCICENILMLQENITSMTECKTASQIEEIMQREITGGLQRLLANFYTCNWSYVVREARDYEFYSLDSNIVYAGARSCLQMREYAKALPLFTLLKKRSRHNTCKPVFEMEIYRGQARCYEGMDLFKKAETTYKKAEGFSNRVDCLGKEKALVKLELASLQVRLYEDREKALAMLFEALKYLLIHEATGGKAGCDELLIEYEKCGYYNRLLFLSNPTREIAHCAYEIGKIFDISGKTVLAHAYYRRAHFLGLRMVIDNDADCLTKVSLLHDMGQKFNLPQYLQQALEVIKQSSLIDEKAKQMECEIHLSEAVCYAKAELGRALSQLCEGLMTDEIHMGDANRQIVHDPESWLSQTKRKLNDVYPDQQHYNYGKLYKAMGDIAQRGKDSSDTAHSHYAKAKHVFNKLDFKIKAAAVYRADGALYYKEKNMEDADDAYEQAQSYLKDSIIDQASKSEYAEVLSERSEVLAAIGSLEESETLKYEADEIHKETEAMRQKLKSAVDAHCKSATDGAAYFEEKDLERAEALYKQAQSDLKDCFAKPKPATENLETIPTTSATEPPDRLELIKYKETADRCIGVSWTEEGNILYSSEGGVEVRSGADLTLIKKINMTGDVYSAYSVGDKLITKVAYKGNVSTYIGTESNPQHTLLYQYVTDCSHLSVSDSRIADIDTESKQLMIYTITGDHLYNIDLSDMSHPAGVHILPDEDSVLVSDWVGGEVRKYKLQPGKHEPVWCTCLRNPSGITTDQSGLIYVVSETEEKIYQISPQGNLIRKLTPTALSDCDHLYDVSVRGDKVVVSGSRGAALFKLTTRSEDEDM